jgi:excisionase family DNA binding protein
MSMHARNKGSRAYLLESEEPDHLEDRGSTRIASIRTSVRPDGLPEMLTVKDLEAILKIDVKTIYSYVRKGLIPYVRIQSNVRFRKEEIFDWIEGQSYRP